MWAEFKEKTFETAFVGELRLLTSIIYAPDQRDEYFLGFDASAYIPTELLPPFLPYIRVRARRHLQGISATELNQFGKSLNDRLPPFRLNLFIQFKRPEYLKRKTASEWNFWKRRYFRYGIAKRQQSLLNKIIEVGCGRAVAVYAVPAFHKSDDLFRNQLDNTIIQNTNVLSAAYLTGHSKCTFVEAGNRGIGHSEPQELQSPSLKELIAEKDEESADESRLPFTRHVKETADTINRLFENDFESRNTLKLAKQAIIGGDLSEDFPRAEGSWFDAVVTMVAFSSAFGIRVCAIG